MLSHPVATLRVAAERLQCGKSELRCVRSVKYTLDCVDMLLWAGHCVGAEVGCGDEQPQLSPCTPAVTV